MQCHQLITRSRTHHGQKSAALELEQNLKELHKQAAAKKNAAKQLSSASNGGSASMGAAVAKALDLSHAGTKVGDLECVSSLTAAIDIITFITFFSAM